MARALARRSLSGSRSLGAFAREASHVLSVMFIPFSVDALWILLHFLSCQHCYYYYCKQSPFSLSRAPFFFYCGTFTFSSSSLAARFLLLLSIKLIFNITIGSAEGERKRGKERGRSVLCCVRMRLSIACCYICFCVSLLVRFQLVLRDFFLCLCVNVFF